MFKGRARVTTVKTISIIMPWSDVPMKGILDQDKVNPSNQEIKALSLLFKELRPVGETVVKDEVQDGMDPGKGHLCWLIT